MVDVLRGGRSSVREARVTVGTPIRVLLRRLGEAAEGCAVLIDDRPVPLDAPIDAPVRLTVVPTFSGG